MHGCFSIIRGHVPELPLKSTPLVTSSNDFYQQMTRCCQMARAIFQSSRGFSPSDFLCRCLRNACRLSYLLVRALNFLVYIRLLSNTTVVKPRLKSDVSRQITALKYFFKDKKDTFYFKIHYVQNQYTTGACQAVWFLVNLFCFPFYRLIHRLYNETNKILMCGLLY